MSSERRKMIVFNEYGISFCFAHELEREGFKSTKIYHEHLPFFSFLLGKRFSGLSHRSFVPELLDFLSLSLSYSLSLSLHPLYPSLSRSSLCRTFSSLTFYNFSVQLFDFWYVDVRSRRKICLRL